jgi:transmembrane sensor
MATKRIATAVGDRKVVALADGSKVELNTASRARVALTGRSREVWLDSGEAYFEVAHRDGLPFIVHAGNRQVTVLGTKFSVRRIGGEVAVSVLEGRVRVDEVEGSRSLRSTIIAGGDIARTSGPATLVIARSDKRVEDSLAWRDGMLSFDGTSLADAAAEFNRYNRKPIVVAGPDVGGMRIGGLFPATKPDAFVRLLRDAYGLKVEEAADSFKVSS